MARVFISSRVSCPKAGLGTGPLVPPPGGDIIDGPPRIQTVIHIQTLCFIIILIQQMFVQMICKFISLRSHFLVLYYDLDFI